MVTMITRPPSSKSWPSLLWVERGGSFIHLKHWRASACASRQRVVSESKLSSPSLVPPRAGAVPARTHPMAPAARRPPPGAISNKLKTPIDGMRASPTPVTAKPPAVRTGAAVGECVRAYSVGRGPGFDIGMESLGDTWLPPNRIMSARPTAPPAIAATMLSGSSNTVSGYSLVWPRWRRQWADRRCRKRWRAPVPWWSVPSLNAGSSTLQHRHRGGPTPAARVALALARARPQDFRWTVVGTSTSGSPRAR